MELMEWIEKNAAEGADLQEAKKLVEGMPKLPQSKEEAAKVVEDNQYIKSELDSRISKSVDNALKKFEETKLPEREKEIRERVQKELNPEETPEQKRVRELEEKLQNYDKERQTEKRKAELREKAKELGFDPLKAERYAAFGEDAEAELEKDVNELQTQINSKLEEEIKKRYGGKEPEAPPEKNENSISRAEFEKMSPKDQMKLVKDGGQVLEGE